MNVEKLQAKLLAVARRNPSNDQVPLAFEKRIMARITRPVIDAWALWGRALWRAAAACVVAVAILGGWSLQTKSPEHTDLSQALENTVFAGLYEQHTLAMDEEIW